MQITWQEVGLDRQRIANPLAPLGQCVTAVGYHGGDGGAGPSQLTKRVDVHFIYF